MTEQGNESSEDLNSGQGEPAVEEGGEKPLGENGEKALKAERDARKAAESAAASLQKQLDEIASANLSDLERAQKEAEDAKQAAAKATTDALRYRIAAESGIHENAELILTGSDEETMRRQAELWTARTPAGPRPDPSQGAKGSESKGTTADMFAAAIEPHFTR